MKIRVQKSGVAGAFGGCFSKNILTFVLKPKKLVSHEEILSAVGVDGGCFAAFGAGFGAVAF